MFARQMLIYEEQAAITKVNSAGFFASKMKFMFRTISSLQYSLSCGGIYVVMPALIVTAHRCRYTMYFKMYPDVHSPGKIHKTTWSKNPCFISESYHQECSFKNKTLLC